ncbi:prephenate dehydrogenase/arogenate dehydrogenase family protein [Marinagarivorans cellulosilyticus]|uniref:prephenate dehydrogenase n=1 Tax=Marinagarivorans cellulosilyticus TaxID=2721545 RepID=A0AAN1WJ64_9GAMM|nr:prephenate dehydrogenase/arogenate dehydrogenase family protein [Marinagarivorans cellulosilyticus]BCD98590.1 3-phosphoshikimate 1-carboxyvinyltransferase [Marinagarivorans cellulosilyticus]
MSADDVVALQPINTLVVIGLGLIGGSLALSLKSAGACKRVVGIAPDPLVRQRAIERGMVDESYASIGDVAAQLGEGDVVFIAVPTLAIREVLESVKGCVPATVTVTDGASVKGSVLEDVKAVYGKVPEQLVLGHPIAGSEQSGVEAARVGLYANHRIILTPTEETSDQHKDRVADMWRAVGAEVLELDVENHDAILGATSHLPHVIAFSLVDTLAHDSHNEDIFRYAAGGFRDFTRIASSDVVMWRDIMLANRDAVLEAIDLFSSNLAVLRKTIAESDSDELTEIFSRAKQARDQFTHVMDKQKS